MKFEMPKMNVAIFSLENVVTTSTNTAIAKKALEDAGIDTDNITTATSASNWLDA